MVTTGVSLWIWRFLRPPTGRPARRVVGAICLIIGIARMGLISYAAETIIPSRFYGWLFLVLAVLIWATSYCRLSIIGRSVSILGFAMLAALATDIFIHSSPGNAMSGLILTYLAYVMLGEIVSQHDC